MAKSIEWKLDVGDQGVLAPGPWLWARAICWALALFAVAVVGFFTSIQLVTWLRLPDAFSYPIAAFLPVITVLIYVAAVRTVEKRRAGELAIRHAPLELLGGGAIGFGFMAATLLLLWWLGLYRVQFGHWKHWYDFFLFNSYISGVLEELAFRAILLRILARIAGPVRGLLISAALFGLAHAGHAQPAAVALIVINGGLAMGLLYMASGRLWLSIGMHIGYDFTEWSIMGVGDKSGLLAIAPTPGHSALLTGGDFGPDGSVFAGLVGALIIVGIVVVASRRPRASR
jgi:membrane protease YdiL (CAAX protease family)